MHIDPQDVGSARSGSARRTSSSLVSDHLAGHMVGYDDGVENRDYNDRVLRPIRRLVLVRRPSLTFAGGYASGFASGQAVWLAEHSSRQART